MKKNIEQVDIESLIPYVNNARVHNNDQVLQIAASIKEFGFTNPVLIDKENGIIAGHGRVMAAKRLKMSSVPCIRLDNLTEAQRKAYVIADNKIALNSTWDEKLLKLELSELKSLNVDLDLVGFGPDELEDMFGHDDLDPDDDTYTQKTDAPTYSPSDEQPSIRAIFDDEKAKRLIDAIQASDCTPEEKTFLIVAAGRHVVFDYQKIADYYAHASLECQEHMEKSALVIIDFNKAIENGFVVMGQKFDEEYTRVYPNENEES